MINFLPKTKKYFFFLLISGVICGCYEKDFNPDDAAAAFKSAREPYDDQNFEISITKLSEFKSRFPYSQYATEAELLIANCLFESGRYEESALSYSQFAKLHPKHAQVDFAQFRVGDSFWALAPDSEDRDQTATVRANEEWLKLIREMPDSKYSKKAATFIKLGQRRVAENEWFIVKFYCRQKIPHACAFRALELAEKQAGFEDIRRDALSRAAAALEVLAEEKTKKPDLDTNLYFANMTAEQIRAKAQTARQLSKK
jgi:outer membrane protein assembly factor BamD